MGRTMERVSVLASVAAVALVALACKGSSSGPADAGAAPVATPSASAAADALERYPDEETVDAVVITLKKATTARLSADTASKVVGELKVGDKILPIAVHGDYALIAIGTDPAADAKGWIPGDVILDALKPKAAAVAAKPALPTCKGEEMLVSENGGPARCAAQCTEDSDCKPGKCTNALVLDAKTGKGLVVNGDTHVMSVCDAASKAAPAVAIPNTKESGFGDYFDVPGACPPAYTKLDKTCFRNCSGSGQCKGEYSSCGKPKGMTRQVCFPDN
jgi:hypothetical protein